MLSSDEWLEFLQELDPSMYSVRSGLGGYKIITRIYTPLQNRFEFMAGIYEHLEEECDIAYMYETICIALRDFGYVIIDEGNRSFEDRTYWTFENDHWREIPRYEAMRRYMERENDNAT